jgi:tight adherence protein B
MQAMDLAGYEIQAPASEEFSRVIREVRLGLTLESALINLSNRMDNDDLYIVVTAIIINTQVGGNLSVVLDSTISTIRGRLQLMAEVRSLTSYSRLVANILSLTPILAAIGLFAMSGGEYFDPVKTSLIAQIGLGMALVMVLFGNLILRRMIDVKV